MDRNLKIVVVGLGLIGGSIFKALCALKCNVYGTSKSNATISKAKEYSSEVSKSLLPLAICCSASWRIFTMLKSAFFSGFNSLRFSIISFSFCCHFSTSKCNQCCIFVLPKPHDLLKGAICFLAHFGRLLSFPQVLPDRCI